MEIVSRVAGGRMVPWAVYHVSDEKGTNFLFLLFKLLILY